MSKAAGEISGFQEIVGEGLDHIRRTPSLYDRVVPA